MKHALPLLVACLWLPCLAGESVVPTTFSPSDPRLVVVERDVRDRGLLTHWRGTVQLRGHLVFEFRRVPPEENELYPEGASYFEPDAASLARLPAALNNLPASPNAIEIRKTPREVLMPILGAKATNAIVNGKRERYLLAADLSLVAFSTSLDCDRRSYAHEYDKIALRRENVVAVAASQNLSC
jgi:hypothetical protein